MGRASFVRAWEAGVLSVVEVADASFVADVDVKARVYGRSGFGAYWVVHRGGVEVLSDPSEAGYREVPYRAGVVLAVADLLDAEE